MTPKLKLTYFDFHGGRGEAARLAMHIGGVPFEDERLAFPDFARLKPELPFGAVPVLEVDGQLVTQSNGINRYVGKLAGLYPDDPWQAALCDEVMDAVEDISAKFAPSFAMKDEVARKAAREAFSAGPLPYFLERLQARLEAHGGQYFADGRLTVADLKFFVWVRHIISGVLDHVPQHLPEQVSPLLYDLFERIKADPRVAGYYARFQ